MGAAQTDTPRSSQCRWERSDWLAGHLDRGTPADERRAELVRELDIADPPEFTYGDED